MDDICTSCLCLSSCTYTHTYIHTKQSKRNAHGGVCIVHSHRDSQSIIIIIILMTMVMSRSGRRLLWEENYYCDDDNDKNDKNHCGWYKTTRDLSPSIVYIEGENCIRSIYNNTTTTEWCWRIETMCVYVCVCVRANPREILIMYVALWWQYQWCIYVMMTWTQPINQPKRHTERVLETATTLECTMTFYYMMESVMSGCDFVVSSSSSSRCIYIKTM